MIAESDLLTVAQVLRILPVGRSMVYRLLASGQLPHYRIRAVGCRRGRVLVARADLDAFLASARHEATRAPTVVDVDALHEKVRRDLARNGRKPARAAENQWMSARGDPCM